MTDFRLTSFEEPAIDPFTGQAVGLLHPLTPAAEAWLDGKYPITTPGNFRFSGAMPVLDDVDTVRRSIAPLTVERGA